MKILVSACLLGENCKYNGGNNYNIDVINYVKKHEYLPICPEQMALFPTPRQAIEIRDGRVIRIDGLDVTEQMLSCLDKIDKILEEFKPDLAILKAKSPSCGYKEIYDGTFTHHLIEGNGIACKHLLAKGIKVIREDELKNE